MIAVGMRYHRAVYRLPGVYIEIACCAVDALISKAKKLAHLAKVPFRNVEWKR